MSFCTVPMMTFPRTEVPYFAYLIYTFTFAIKKTNIYLVKLFHLFNAQNTIFFLSKGTFSV